MLATTPPLPQYFDLDGSPLDGGSIYFGALGLNPQTNPAAIYWDAAGTQPAAQPVRTLNGYTVRSGTPTQVFLSGGYSIMVLNRRGVMVFYAPDSSQYSNDQSLAADLTALTDGLANKVSGALGPALVGYGFMLPYALDTVGDQLNRINSGTVHLFRFLSPTQLTDALAGAGLVAAQQALLDASAYILSRGWNRGTIRMGQGVFSFTDEAPLWRASSLRQDITIEGDDQLTTIIEANFYGADKAVISAKDPAGLARASPISFRNLGFRNKSTTGGVNPVFIDVLGMGESRIDFVRFGNSNNTHLRVGSAQNVKSLGLISFYGGRHFNKIDTDGVTFDVDGGTKVVTASAPIFPTGSSLVGKYLSIFPSDPSRRAIYQVASVTDSTHLVVTETALSETGAEGHIEPARCSIALGDQTLVADAPCFTSDMVGLVIWIRGAEAGSFGNAKLRATITAFNSPTSVEIDTPATTACVSEFFGVAAVEFYQPTAGGTLGAGASDVKLMQMQIEHYDGIAFVGQNTDSFWIGQSKIHGETSPSDAIGSLAAMWLDDFGGTIECDLDSSCALGDCRIHASNFNDLTTFRGSTRGIIHNVIFKSNRFTDPGGYLAVEMLNAYVDTPDPMDMIVDANFLADANDPRIVPTGFINMLGDSQPARNYVGRGAYFQPTGRFVPAGGAANVSIASTITWDGSAPGGTANRRYSWQQIGGMVCFSFRIEHSVAGSSNSTVSVAKPSDMPAPAAITGAGSGEILSANVQGYIGTGPTSTALTRAVMQEDGAGDWKFVLALNSGTVAAAFATFSGFYFTDA